MSRFITRCVSGRDGLTGRRRLLLTAAAALSVLAPPGAWAQAAATARPRRIALLSQSSEAAAQPSLQLMRRYLADMGMAEGRDYVFDSRFADFKTERLAPLATELLALQPDVIIAPGPAAAAAFRVDSKVPLLVMGDPVLAQQAIDERNPGGRVTGVNILFQPLNIKRMEFLAEVVPRGSAVMVIATPAARAVSVPDLQATCERLGLRMHTAYAESEATLDDALQQAAHLKVAGINQLNSPILWGLRQRTYRAAEALRIPASYQWAEAAAEGGLMAYGPRNPDMWRQMMRITKRVLDGEAPGNIPIESPTLIHLTLNRTSAARIGLNFPASLLARADEVVV